MNRLDEFDKDEWRKVLDAVADANGRPRYSDEEFERKWEQFVARKNVMMKIREAGGGEA